MKKILVSGCSFTAGQNWPVKLFSESNITNVARSGSGNEYIADSIIYNTVDNKPDFIFILWSGINRVDIKIPVTPFTENYAEQKIFYGKNKETYYIFSGGNKIPQTFKDNYHRIFVNDPFDGQSKSAIDNFLRLPMDKQLEAEKRRLFYFQHPSLDSKLEYYSMLQYLNNSNYLENMSYSNIVKCLYFIESCNIPYKFSFIMNPFDVKNDNEFGNLSKTNKFYNFINWENYIDLTPYEYAIKYGKLQEDNFHPTEDSMYNWVDSIKKYFD